MTVSGIRTQIQTSKYGIERHYSASGVLSQGLARRDQDGQFTSQVTNCLVIIYHNVSLQSEHPHNEH